MACPASICSQVGLTAASTNRDDDASFPCGNGPCCSASICSRSSFSLDSNFRVIAPFTNGVKTRPKPLKWKVAVEWMHVPGSLLMRRYSISPIERGSCHAYTTCSFSLRPTIHISSSKRPLAGSFRVTRHRDPAAEPSPLRRWESITSGCQHFSLA